MDFLSGIIMPRNIERYSPTMASRYQGVRHDLLAKSRMIIGETHSKPYARAVILDLIEEGLVGKLFLEIPNENISFLNIAGVRSYQDYFDSKIGHMVQFDNSWAQIQNYISGSITHDNSIPLTELIRVALRHGVKVIAYDVAVNQYGRINRYHLAKRNEAMGKVRRQDRGLFQNRASILLVGQWHNEPSQTFNGLTLSKASGVRKVINIEDEYQAAVRTVNQQLGLFDSSVYFPANIPPVNLGPVGDMVDMDLINRNM